jgi:hypothetical protein
MSGQVWGTYNPKVQEAEASLGCITRRYLTKTKPQATLIKYLPLAINAYNLESCR